jgi:hypothetical protein
MSGLCLIDGHFCVLHNCCMRAVRPQLGLDIRTDDLISQNKIEPLIIVAPETGPRYEGGGYEDFISSELIQYIDKVY